MTERVATLEEIHRHWSLTDLLDAHTALDLKEEATRRAHERATKRR